jgi:hypothetical protein
LADQIPLASYSAIAIYSLAKCSPRNFNRGPAAPIIIGLGKELARSCETDEAKRIVDQESAFSISIATKIAVIASPKITVVLSLFPSNSGLAWASCDPAHRALHGIEPGAVQGFLAGTVNETPDFLRTRARRGGLVGRRDCQKPAAQTLQERQQSLDGGVCESNAPNQAAAIS